MIAFVNADLGKFDKDVCVNIPVPLNVSSVNITNVQTPSPNSTLIILNAPMTKTGNLFNYTFCNTHTQGIYTYGFIDSNGNTYSNTFEIKTSANGLLNIDNHGSIFTISQGWLFIPCYNIHFDFWHMYHRRNEGQ